MIRFFYGWLNLLIIFRQHTVFFGLSATRILYKKRISVAGQKFSGISAVSSTICQFCPESADIRKIMAGYL
ncbi:Uncharacterized protein dnm_077410 [Desulfonema magnum]|uniref:Uncharacterized protein n=1 Tax=Desulfonema magnum TaxID=45655 RepID=A0A975BUT2_9BACT|nr:Uncharacterized protein dnm_077410 [Desulfonema magnum]